jgi:hypothetical protein
MGDWSDVALAQVGHEFTSQIDVGDDKYAAPTDAAASQILRGGVAPKSGSSSVGFLGIVRVIALSIVRGVFQV